VSGVYEDPSRLLGRLRLGREEFCQRLLTMLILGGPYPRWNMPSTPSAAGVRFLGRIHELSFGEPLEDSDACVFVDEFDLPRRSEDEPGGAPDYAVLRPNRLWLIELKTEKGSHRPGQVPQYFDLGRHHHPTCAVDLTYLTPSMTAHYDPPGPWARYAHLTWDRVAAPLHEVWGPSAESAVQTVLARLLDTIADLDRVRASQWQLTTLRVGPDTGDPLLEAVALAEACAADGDQRALDHRPHDLEDLQRLRLEVRQRLCASEPGASLRRVMPWLWQPRSGGQPMTAAGAELGFELRLSRYEKPIC
jgi:hypothetical protein